VYLSVSLHGSWNRSEGTGFKVVRVPVVNGQAQLAEDFVSGWLTGPRGPTDAWGRPVDVQVAPDGALYLSDAAVPTEMLEAGGLVAYGFDLADLFQDSAGFVARILRGERPATMPFQQPTRFDLLVDLKTADALGVTVPPSVLGRAVKIVN
jgi:hypothetical protein